MTTHDLSGWASFLVGWGLPFTAYVAAQLVALVRLRGQARAWSALAVPFMAWVVWLTVGAYREQSNLWPLALIFLSPVALLYLGLVAMIARARTSGREGTGDARRRAERDPAARSH